MQIVRFDAPGEILGTEVAPDGSIRATADVARCGVYEYRRADGSVRRELVLPEHLFDPESLKTLAGVAVTAHPPTGHPPELLTPENAAKYAVGHVHETVDAVESEDERDFGYVRVRLTGRTADAVRQLQNRPLYTSPGYTLPQYDARPGVHPIWGPYDAIQGPRVYNHLALTDSPRGGEKMVVHLDSASVDAAIAVRGDPAGVDETLWEKAKKAAEEQGRGGDYAYITGIYKKMGGTFDTHQDSREPRREEKTMSTVQVRLDAIGRNVDVDTATAEVLAREFERRDAEKKSIMDRYEALKADMATRQKELDALKAKVDEAMSALEKAQGEKTAAEEKAKADAARADAAEAKLADPKALREILRPRMDLEATAREILPQDRHDALEGMTDDEIRRAVVSTLLPGIQVDDASGPRLDGLYTGALASRQRNDGKTPPKRDPKAPDPKSVPARGDGWDRMLREQISSEYTPPKR